VVEESRVEAVSSTTKIVADFTTLLLYNYTSKLIYNDYK